MNFWPVAVVARGMVLMSCKSEGRGGGETTISIRTESGGAMRIAGVEAAMDFDLGDEVAVVQIEFLGLREVVVVANLIKLSVEFSNRSSIRLVSPGVALRDAVLVGCASSMTAGLTAGLLSSLLCLALHSLWRATVLHLRAISIAALGQSEGGSST